MKNLPVNIVRRGEGLPLLFIHANGTDHRMMLCLDSVFESLSPQETWERIYIDLPGFGQTPPLDGPGGLPQLAQWLDDFVEQLLGSDPFAIVGSSLGGLLACALVSKRSKQCVGMALLAPVVDPDPSNRKVPDETVLICDKSFITELTEEERDAYCSESVIQTRENWERFRESVLPGMYCADEQAMKRLWENYSLPELADGALLNFSAPVLIVAGKQDAGVGFEDQWALSQSIPGSTYAMLDHAGHNVQIDQPQAVEGLLRGWAAQVIIYTLSD